MSCTERAPSGIDGFELRIHHTGRNLQVGIIPLERASAGRRALPMSSLGRTDTNGSTAGGDLHFEMTPRLGASGVYMVQRT